MSTEITPAGTVPTSQRDYRGDALELGTDAGER